MASEGTTGPSTSASSEVEQRIIAMGQKHPDGFSNDDLADELSDVLPNQRANSINELLRKGFVDLFTQGKVLMYKIKSASPKAIKGGDNEERVVYGIIQEANTQGIWIKDIRIKSNLPANQLNKVLKLLENKKLIKCINSATGNKKKMYLLYDLQPDVSLTGGAWYGKDDFEAEFVDILNKQATKYLKHNWESAKKREDMDPDLIRNLSYVTVADVLRYIESLGICNIKLTEQDIESLMNTIVYDGLADRKVMVDETITYRYVERLLDNVGLQQTPCGVCPNLEKCSINGTINPVDCSYFSEWVNGFMA